MPEKALKLPPKYPYMGTFVNQVTPSELIQLILAYLSSTKTLTISYVNPHAINLGHSNPLFRQHMNAFDVIHCDGFGIKWGAAWTGIPPLARMTGPDWAPLLLEQLAATPYRVFFLGDEEHVVQTAVDCTHKKYPGLSIAGFHHGFFNQDPNHPESRAVLERIKQSEADFVLLGMGMPLQETWVQAHQDDLPGVRIFLCLGAIFGHLGGLNYRAPAWICAHGFEWLARLLHEPSKYASRYITGNIRYLRHFLPYWLRQLRTPAQPCGE